MIKNPLYFVAISVIVLTSCEDVIDIQTPDAPNQWVVDAWINNLPAKQIIRITESQPYFNNEFSPGVLGAEVSISSDRGEVFIFEDEGTGDYSWLPPADSVFGAVGSAYELTIRFNDHIITGQSVMNPVPSIDSITQELRLDELGPDGIYAEFFARDLPGLGNTYWIKAFKNNQFLNKPSEINLAFDGGFDAGAEIDGIIFIPPIREFINPDPDSSEMDVSPYRVTDRVRVEIHSINLDAFLFLESARDQILNGNNTIFAFPIANSPGNLSSADPNEEILGIFNVASVTSKEKTIE